MVKNLLANAGKAGSISELGGSPGGRNGNPFQYSCLENSMDRGAWKVIVNGVAKSRIRLSTHTHTILLMDLGQRVNLFVRVENSLLVNMGHGDHSKQACFLPSPNLHVTFGKALNFISGGRCY